MAQSVANENSFWGMIIYERRGDGTLHGEWKNNRLSNDSILNEIARKNDLPDTIAGDYIVAWIEENSESRTGTLTIQQIENNTALSFIWREGGIEVFRGMGMPIGLNKIAVTYWNTQKQLKLRF